MMRTPRAAVTVLGLAAAAAVSSVPLRAGPTSVVPRRVVLKTASGASLATYLYEPPGGGTGETPDTPASAVVFYSGEYGWGPLPQETASHLAAEGRHVLGIDSPDYFKKRIEATALVADLRSFRAFVNDGAKRPADAPVILAGFAYGAEMIPYVLSRAGAAGVRGLLLIAPDREGAAVYRAAVRLKMETPPEEAFDVAEEIGRLPPLPVVLMQGALDQEGAAQSLLPLLRGSKIFMSVPGGDRMFRDVRGPYLGQVSRALRFIEEPQSAPAAPTPTGQTPAEGAPPERKPSPP